MHARTELFLIEMLWGLDILSSPNLIWKESFDNWSHRHHLARRIAELESLGVVESKRGPNLERLYRLTESGLIAALGGRDPIEHYNRPWNQQWHTLAYDVPVGQRGRRLALIRRLKALHFGRLQGSFWATPFPFEFGEILQGLEIDVRNLFTISGRPELGETDADIVKKAWDFAAINQAYDQYLDHIRPANRPKNIAGNPEWRAKEQSLWLRAMRLDPLLPRVLWTKGYRGEQAFFARAGLLAAY